MKTITTNGTYKAPSGQDIQYPYEYQAFSSLQEAIAELGEIESLKLMQRMVKVDGNNEARAKARVANGHSTAKVQTEEEKARAKASRQANASLIAALAARGIKTLDDLQAQL